MINCTALLSSFAGEKVSYPRRRGRHRPPPLHSSSDHQSLPVHHHHLLHRVLRSQHSVQSRLQGQHPEADRLQNVPLRSSARHALQDPGIFLHQSGGGVRPHMHVHALLDHQPLAETLFLRVHPRGEQLQRHPRREERLRLHAAHDRPVRPAVLQEVRRVPVGGQREQTETAEPEQRVDAGETPTEDHQELAGEAGASSLHAERDSRHRVRPGGARGACLFRHLNIISPAFHFKFSICIFI